MDGRVLTQTVEARIALSEALPNVFLAKPGSLVLLPAAQQVKLVTNWLGRWKTLQSSMAAMVTDKVKGAS